MKQINEFSLSLSNSMVLSLRIVIPMPLAVSITSEWLFASISSRKTSDSSLPESLSFARALSRSINERMERSLMQYDTIPHCLLSLSLYRKKWTLLEVLFDLILTFLFYEFKPILSSWCYFKWLSMLVCLRHHTSLISIYSCSKWTVMIPLCCNIEQIIVTRHWILWTWQWVILSPEEY